MLAKDKIEGEYKNYIKIYTDASKTTTGHVGIGCYVHIDGRNLEIYGRTTDNVGITTGEMVAIREGLKLIQQLEKSETNNDNNYVIFSDSLSAITNFISGRSHSRPNLYNDVMETINNINSHITLTWIPSHVGIPGNEHADKLANIGTGKKTIEYDIGYEKHEANSWIHQYITKLWQEEWDNNTTGRHHYTIKPTTGSKSNRRFSSRRAEVTSCRLRLGKCRLNYYLKEISAHDTGQCQHCNQPETIQHYIIDCPHNGVATEVNKLCANRQLKRDLRTILNDTRMLEEIHRLTTRRL
jgi:ribonuclease HI